MNCLRFIPTIPVFWIFLSCNNTDRIAFLEKQVDSLKAIPQKVYKPGFGEFMSSIQVHHAKLWFAGQASNWPLARFEIGEIKENLAAIAEYQADRPESRYLQLLDPALDSISATVKAGNKTEFRGAFVFLTNSCNTCHKENHFEFNRVTIPANPPFSNQDFSVAPVK